MDEPNLDFIIDKELSLEEKISIKYAGPPRPELNLKMQSSYSGSTSTRKFNFSMYTASSWVCGCAKRNAFFCFVCLLTNPDRGEKAWTTTGVTDLKNFWNKLKRHNLCASHMHNEIDFALLADLTVEEQLERKSGRPVQAQTVKPNFTFLNKVIDVMTLAEISNLSDLKTAIRFCTATDSAFKAHIEANKFLTETSTHEDILESIEHVSREIIKKQVEETKYVALIVDQISHKQFIILIRYEFKEEIVERFWGVFTLNSKELADLVLEQCEMVGLQETPYKLVSHSYSGNNLTDVAKKIGQKYKNARLVHSYVHDLYSVIEETFCSSNQKLKVFFANIGGFKSFFSKRKIAEIDGGLPIDKLSEKKISVLITNLYNYKEALLGYFEEIAMQEHDQVTIRECFMLQTILKNQDFIFWLSYFNRLLPHVDTFYNQLQQGHLYPIEVKTYISEFIKNVQIVNDLVCDSIDSEDEPSAPKNPRLEDDNQQMLKDVYQHIKTCIEERFDSSIHLCLPLLVHPGIFNQYVKKFPTEVFDEVTNAYQFLDQSKLRTELTVLYSRKEFLRVKAPLSLLHILWWNQLTNVLCETAKVLEVACTTPMITTDVRLKFSKLQNANSILSSDGGVPALAMCCLEKEMIQNTVEFNDRVVHHFTTKKERPLDFISKNFS